MALPESVVRENGSVTIPTEIRGALGLKPNDRVEFEIVDGRAVLIPVRRSIFDYFMSIPALDTPLTDDEMEDAFEQGVADEVVASMAREDSVDQ
jgi:AbrB family looped-hinge helix DNA binding protein